jgi:hypothetical protein
VEVRLPPNPHVPTALPSPRICCNVTRLER